MLASQGFKVSRLEEEQLSERDLKSDRELRSERELKSDRKMKRKPVSREQEL